MSYRLFSQYRSELMGVAILWVMFFHAWDLNMGHPLLEFIRAAGFGGVDIFILLSAMGLVMSLSKKEQDYTAFMARRARRILPAYYTVMVPYTLFLILTQDVFWSALIWNATLLYYWMRSAGAFNWYVAGAMTFYAVTPFCFRKWRAAKNREALTAAGVIAGLLVCQLLMQEGYWYVTDVFYRIPVFFLGLLLGFYVTEDKTLTARHLLFWTGSLAAGVLYLLAQRVEQDAVHLPLCHLFLFTTVPMCLVLCACFDRLPIGWLGQFFRLLGENSLEIYLFNVSFFSQTEVIRRFISFGPSNRLYYLVMFAANILLGVGLHRLIASISARRRPAQ